jgi:hypothetical protein
MYFLKYTHPAAMKYEINKSYSLDELKLELSDDMIKVLFIPINFKWEDFEPKIEVKKEQKNVEKVI